MNKVIPEKKIEDGNRVIMEFTSWKRTHLEYFMPPEEIRSYCVPMCPCDAKYHLSWDWLMPVVEKIAKIKLVYENVNESYNPYPRTFGMLDEEGNFMVRLNCAQLFTAQTLIEATWLAVVDFINTYNDKTKL